MNKLGRTDDPNGGITVHGIDAIKTRFSLVVGEVLEVPTDDDPDAVRRRDGDVSGVVDVFRSEDSIRDISLASSSARSLSGP